MLDHAAQPVLNHTVVVRSHLQFEGGAPVGMVKRELASSRIESSRRGRIAHAELRLCNGVKLERHSDRFTRVRLLRQ